MLRVRGKVKNNSIKPCEYELIIDGNKPLGTHIFSFHLWVYSNISCYTALHVTSLVHATLQCAIPTPLYIKKDCDSWLYMNKIIPYSIQAI